MKRYFLQISDTHFLENYETNHDFFREAFLNMNSPVVKLKAVAEDLAKMDGVSLDFICHCGDFCHNGKDSDYEFLKTTLAQLFPQVPLLVTSGNRDSKESFSKAFPDYDSGAVSEIFGEEDPLQVISFCNSNGEIAGELLEETCREVLNLMDQHKFPTILFSHHHFLPEQIYNMKSVEQPALFSEILAQENLLALLNGHTHHHFQGVLGSVPCYTVESMSFVARNRGTDVLEIYETGGYHLFSYENGKVSLEKIGNLNFAQSVGIAMLP